MKSEKEIAGTLSDIQKMMQRSSRFISLSGWSGVAAGVCALVGAAFAYPIIEDSSYELIRLRDAFQYHSFSLSAYMQSRLFKIALITFFTALILSFLFTWLRSKKTNTPMWGFTARRLVFNMSVPMAAGGLYILKLMEAGAYVYIAPGCLLVYGLSLLNASKYTLDECLIEKSSYRYVLSKGNLEDARKHFFFIEALDYVFISISPVLEGGIEDYFLEQVVIKFLEDYKT